MKRTTDAASSRGDAIGAAAMQGLPRLRRCAERPRHDAVMEIREANP